MTGEDRNTPSGEARDRRNRLLGRILLIALGLVVLAYIVPVFLSLK